MRNNPACWFEIYVQDMPRAKAFYEGVLGVQLARLNNPDIDMWAFGMDPATTGAGGALVWADPVAKVAIGYAMNKMDHMIRSPRALALCHAVYACVARHG